MKQLFTKYQGAGNDFLLIDDRKEHFPFFQISFVQRLCSRNYGVGADGIILLQNSYAADFRMRIFNSDGTEAQSCGNGLRCFVQFLAKLKLLNGKKQIETLGGIVTGWVEEDKTYIALDYSLPPVQKLNLSLEKDFYFSYFVNSGVPHLIHFVKDLERFPLLKIGKGLRSHPLLGKEGANVNFVEQRGESLYVRTFERGVEGETLACGTGAIAAAWTVKKVLNKKNPILLHFPGGTLEVEIGKKVVMTGPTEEVFEGSYFSNVISTINH